MQCEVDIHYEWKPVTCEKCKKMGHSIEKCRVQMQKKWVPRNVGVPKPARIAKTMTKTVQGKEQEDKGKKMEGMLGDKAGKGVEDFVQVRRSAKKEDSNRHEVRV